MDSYGSRELDAFFRTVEHRSTNCRGRALRVKPPSSPRGFPPRSRPSPRTRTTAQWPREHRPQSVSTALQAATAPPWPDRCFQTAAVLNASRRSGRRRLWRLFEGTRDPFRASRERKWNRVAAHSVANQDTQRHRRSIPQFKPGCSLFRGFTDR